MTKTSTSFKKGRSGNPKGKPRGAKNRATVAAQTLLDGEAETLTRKVIELAKAGDMTALRLCLERIVPPRRERPINLALPPLTNAADGPEAMKAIVAAVTGGEIMPSEAQVLAGLVETYRRTIETEVLEHRIAVLEQARK